MATLSRPSIESQFFFDTLSRRQHGVLVIDFDSTIAQLGRADNVFPYPTVQELLDCIATMTGTRVIVATSRPAEQLRSYFSWPGAEIRTLSEIATMDAFVGRSPRAFLSGEGGDHMPGSAQRLRVFPQYRVDSANDAGAPPEDLVQFLVEWLRACAGETC